MRFEVDSVFSMAEPDSIGHTAKRRRKLPPFLHAIFNTIVFNTIVRRFPIMFFFMPPGFSRQGCLSFVLTARSESAVSSSPDIVESNHLIKTGHQAPTYRV